MSIFSDKLRTFVKQKGHNIYSLAKYCRMDRSNMYKIVQGTRHPARWRLWKILPSLWR